MTNPLIHPLFEDNHLLILNKPAGLLTEPSGTMQKSLQEEAKLYLKEKYQKPGNVYLGIVHRLDKPASGIVLFAKTSKALSRLNQAMRERKFQKTYMALVEEKEPLKSVPLGEEKLLENYLVHEEYRAVVSKKENKEAKLSRLRFKIVKREKGFLLLEILLETGRYHQIRAQLAHFGFPLLGDEKYGSQCPFFEERIALHHIRLKFPHPVTGLWVGVEAPLPFIFLKDF